MAHQTHMILNFRGEFYLKIIKKHLTLAKNLFCARISMTKMLWMRLFISVLPLACMVGAEETILGTDVTSAIQHGKNLRSIFKDKESEVLERVMSLQSGLDRLTDFARSIEKYTHSKPLTDSGLFFEKIPPKIAELYHGMQCMKGIINTTLWIDAMLAKKHLDHTDFALKLFLSNLKFLHNLVEFFDTEDLPSRMRSVWAKAFNNQEQTLAFSKPCSVDSPEILITKVTIYCQHIMPSSKLRVRFLENDDLYFTQLEWLLLVKNNILPIVCFKDYHYIERAFYEENVMPHDYYGQLFQATVLHDSLHNLHVIRSAAFCNATCHTTKSVQHLTAFQAYIHTLLEGAINAFAHPKKELFLIKAYIMTAFFHAHERPSVPLLKTGVFNPMLGLIQSEKVYDNAFTKILKIWFPNLLKDFSDRQVMHALSQHFFTPPEYQKARHIYSPASTMVSQKMHAAIVGQSVKQSTREFFDNHPRYKILAPTDKITAGGVLGIIADKTLCYPLASPKWEGQIYLLGFDDAQFIAYYDKKTLILCIPNAFEAERTPSGHLTPKSARLLASLKLTMKVILQSPTLPKKYIGLI